MIIRLCREQGRPENNVVFYSSSCEGIFGNMRSKNYQFEGITPNAIMQAENASTAASKLAVKLLSIDLQYACSGTYSTYWVMRFHCNHIKAKCMGNTSSALHSCSISMHKSSVFLKKYQDCILKMFRYLLSIGTVPVVHTTSLWFCCT